MMAINDEIIINDSNKENKKPNDNKCDNDCKSKEFRFEIQSNGVKDNIKLHLNNKEILNDKDAACMKIEQSIPSTTNTNTTTSSSTTTTATKGDEPRDGEVVGGVASPVTVPQTLISCLDELQHNGKLVSWKIRGEGENLTVKVTWNSKNNEKKYRKYTTSHLLSRKDKIYQAESSDKDSGYLTPYQKFELFNEQEYEVKCFAKLDETKISPLTLKQIETDKKLKDEINRFHDALLQILNELKVKLNEKQTKKMDKVEYDKLLLSSRIELVSVITNLVQTLHIKLAESNLNKDKLEFDIKLIVFNEIESSLKLRCGSLLKEIEKISDSESDYPRAYEDYLATSILRKLTTKQTFSNIIEIMSANISDDLTLKEADTENWGKSVEDNLDTAKNDSYSLRPKQKFSVNDNLLLSLYSLMEDSKKENGGKLVNNIDKLENTDQQQDLINNLNSELDLELASSVRKINNEQDNWSFRKSKKLHENFDSAKDPVVMTIPEPNANFSPTIGDQDIEQLSDMTLNESNEENVNYEEEELMDQDELMNETQLSIENDENNQENDDFKFPIPQNMMSTNNKSPKSSSYYRPIDDRLESDSDSEMDANGKRYQKSIEEKAKISPKAETKDPIFTERPSDRLVRIGETAKFQCKVEGTKPLEVFWYKIDDDELQNNEKYELFHDDEYYYLKIYNTVQRDSGTYLCVISNDIDQNFDSFTLKLRDNPRNFRSPKFMLELNDIEVEEGYSATFKVKLDFGYPKCRVLFYRNSKLILNDPKHEIYYCGDGVYHLHLPFVTDEDNAQYMCVAVNNGGRAVSKAELYVAERENIRRPDMLLKLTTPSYRSLDAFKFMDNDNKYFALTKSIDSFDNRSSKSSTDANNNQKIRTDSPSTVSYELLNETYYDRNKYEPEVVLKAISSLNTGTMLGVDRSTFQSLSVDTKKDDIINNSVNNNENNNCNSNLNESCDANDQIQKSYDNPYEMDNYQEHDNYNETIDKHKQLYKNYSPFIENSLTLVTSPINKVSENLLSSSSVGSSILQMITPLQYQVIEEKSEKSDSNAEKNSSKPFKQNNLNICADNDENEKEDEKDDDDDDDEDDNQEDDDGVVSRCGEYQVNQNDEFNDENNFEDDHCMTQSNNNQDILKTKRNSITSNNDLNEINNAFSQDKEFNSEKAKLKSNSGHTNSSRSIATKISIEDLKNIKPQQNPPAMNISSRKFIEISSEPEELLEPESEYEIIKPVGKLSIDPLVFEKPVINKNKTLQSEYKSLELEPVKERKKIWEQKASTSSSYIERKLHEESNLKNFGKKKSTGSLSSGDISRKWSSMVSIFDEGANNINNNMNITNNNGSKVHSRKSSIESSGSVVIIQSANSLSNINMNASAKEINGSSQNITIQNHNIEINQLPTAKPVLVEIVTFDKETLQKPDNLSLDETNDILIPLEKVDSSDSNIVQKLKQKFDHKDQSFVKVASLTCRNVFKDGFKSRQNNLNNRPMLSLYEPSQCESLQKIESLPQSSRNSVLIQSNTSINTNKNSNIATITTTTIAYNTNITSDTSTSTLSSSINNSTSSLKSSNNGEKGISALKFNNASISHSDDNNENKLSQNSNIHEIVPARPESFCKIYDSSNDQNIDSSSKNNLNATNSSNEKSRKSTNDFSVDYGINVQDLVKDYKKLMNSNFSNSKRRESSVLSRAKLWENASK